MLNPRLHRIAFTSWLLTALVAGSPTPCIAADAAAERVITLHADGEVRRTTVRLSDLFNNVPPVIDREIAQAPLPGQSQVYESRVLTKLAEKYRLDWQPQSVGDHVAINCPASHITTEMLRDGVIRAVRAAGGKGEIDVAFDGKAPAIDLPADQQAAFTLNNFDYDPQGKRFRADVATDGPTGQSLLPVAGKITIKKHVPILAHRLEAGALVSASDIDWADVADEKLGGVLTAANDVVGHELRHSLADGDVIRAGDVMPPRLVKRGSLITMKIESDYMTLTAQGRALQDGTDGETVRVTNTASQRMIEATVTGPDTVTVHIAQKLALNQ